MNAVEQLKAEEATRRQHEDVRDCVVEAIGEIFARRASRKALPNDKLIDINIDPRDYEFIFDWCVEQLELDRTRARLNCLEINTVEQLTSALERMFYPAPAEVAP